MLLVHLLLNIFYIAFFIVRIARINRNTAVQEIKALVPFIAIYISTFILLDFAL